MQRLNYKNIVFNLGFVLTCLISVCLFWKNAILLIVVLAAISGIGLYKWKNKETTVVFIISGILGAITESIAISFGVWAYTVPDFIGIPFWLPILWGNAAMFSYQTAIETRNLRL